MSAVASTSTKKARRSVSNATAVADDVAATLAVTSLKQMLNLSIQNRVAKVAEKIRMNQIEEETWRVRESAARAEEAAARAQAEAAMQERLKFAEERQAYELKLQLLANK